MIRHKWTIGTRNKLVGLCNECDSAAAIEGAKLTPSERKELQNLIRKAYNYIDERI